MFAGSIQMIFFSMLTCAIGSQGGPNKMAASNFLWLHFLNNRSSIQVFFFLRSEYTMGTASEPAQLFWKYLKKFVFLFFSILLSVQRLYIAQQFGVRKVEKKYRNLPFICDLFLIHHPAMCSLNSCSHGCFFILFSESPRPLSWEQGGSRFLLVPLTR